MGIRDEFLVVVRVRISGISEEQAQEVANRMEGWAAEVVGDLKAGKPKIDSDVHCFRETSLRG